MATCGSLWLRSTLLLALGVGCRSHVPKDRPGTAPPAPPAPPAPVVNIAVAKPLPPPDRDGDTIPDARDACPDEPEDLDQFEDDDGCVDRDNDGDNIPDAHEWKDGRWTNCDFRMADGIEVDCRNLPEDFDDNDDLDGCPEFVSYDGPAPLVTLHYRRPGRLSAAELAPLDQVARRLREEPELRAWIDAHVDRQRDQKATDARRDGARRARRARSRRRPPRAAWHGRSATCCSREQRSSRRDLPARRM